MDRGRVPSGPTGQGFSSPSENSPPKVLFSLKTDVPDDPRLVNFHQMELFSGMTFRWSEPVSMIRIRMPQANARVLIDTASLRGEALDFPFQIHWNDYQVSPKAIQVNQGILSFEISAKLCEPTGEQRLTISSRPLKAENGRRLLGIPLRSIEVVESSQSEVATVPFAKHETRTGSRWGNPFSLGRTVTPSIPIWQVRIPDLSYVPATGSGQAERVANYPACDQVVVSACEINARHGTGLLIQYLVDNFENLATVNSYHCYNGDRVTSKVHHCLPDYSAMTRQQIYEQVHDWFAGHPPRQAYVVPYFASDFVIASALKDLFRTKVCIHVMDDNCLYGNIPADVVQEAINKCDLLVMISPEMRNAYEQRFGKKAYMLPPIVPQQFIPSQVLPPPQLSATSAGSKSRRVWNQVKSWLGKSKQERSGLEQPRGILIGNVWDKAWLDMLRQTIRSSGLQIDWYANNPNALWLNVSKAELEADGIHLHHSLWGQDLVDEMRRRPFAIMPTGALNGEGNKESIARLSLPSRVPFIVATAQLPIIVLGSPETAASRFLERFGLGVTVSYDGSALRSAVQDVLQPENQFAIRQRAQDLGSKFSSSGTGTWLWQSLERGEPVDDRFEEPFKPQPGEFGYYFDAQPPASVHWSFRETWKLIHRIKQQKFSPEVIIDVGASTGIWSWTASTIFPDAKFILVDPLMKRYPDDLKHCYLSKIKSQQFLDVALSDHCGEMEMLVSDDLYGSSLLKVNESIRKSELAKVELITLEELARRCQVKGRTLLKIDVQFAEHLVINGGLDFIRKQVDFVILELTLHRAHKHAKTYREMLEMMDQLGFEVIDEMEGWRDPQTGVLEQKDTVFVRRERHPMLQAA